MPIVYSGEDLNPACESSPRRTPRRVARTRPSRQPERPGSLPRGPPASSSYTLKVPLVRAAYYSTPAPLRDRYSRAESLVDGKPMSDEHAPELEKQRSQRTY